VEELKQARNARPTASAPPPDNSEPAPPAAVDRQRLAELVADARGNGSAALVILRDGVTIAAFENAEARAPIQTMSITKSILSLAVGTLVDAGKLQLEQPVHEWYPAWRGAEKSRVTLYHLLSHTSGLEEGESSTEIYARDSFVDFTLRSKLIHEPGTHYEYSNRGANLLSGIVAKASGMRTDRYVARVLLEPLGITRYSWALDRAGAAQGLAGLHLLPRDLAKLGQLVLGGGVWRGRRILSEAWLRRATTELAPLQPTNKRLGLMWWLVPQWTRVTVDAEVVEGWRAAGADPQFIDKTRPLVGRRFQSVGAFVNVLREHFGDKRLSEWNDNTWKRGARDARFEFGPVVGCYAAGSLGQYLVILPRQRIVAVRMRRAPQNPAERENTVHDFPDFVERVQALVR
jgi:CubicO group peptidase (beta-lactamase class C family)